MITLYYAPRTRASRFVWLLEELGAPYQLKRVALRKPDGSGGDADYLKIHPHGKVPAIDHDGEIVFESAAIALYLADAFPAAKLAPAIGAPTRGAFVTWLAYYAGVMEPSFVGKALGFTLTNSTTGWAPPADVLAYLVSTLQRGPFLLGAQLSSADILFASTFALFKGSPLLPSDPTIEAYVARCIERPAYAKAQAVEAAQG